MDVTPTTVYPDADAAAYVFPDTAKVRYLRVVNESNSQQQQHHQLLQLCDRLNATLRDEDHSYAYKVGFAQVIVEDIERIIKEQTER
jgi:hypothetical protein